MNERYAPYDVTDVQVQLLKQAVSAFILQPTSHIRADDR